MVPPFFIRSKMKRTEICELTTFCLVRDGDKFLLQDRVKKDWQGCTLPGGHIEPGESIVESVIREMREETGLTVLDPKLCGIKQFPLNHKDYSEGRYLVFLFIADKFEGELKSSEEGAMHWVHRDELDKVNLVSDFHELMEVMLSSDLSEFQYVVDDGSWNVIMK